MASLTPFDTHLNGYLADTIQAYRPTGFIANQIWPVLLVDKLNGSVPKVLPDNWLRNSNLVRAFGESAKAGAFTVVSGGVLYRCVNYGAAAIIPMELESECDWIGILERGAEFCAD